jgi:hypothetical protein
MKHASAKSLDGLESLLKAMRAAGLLNEKSRGIFYLASKAFLHFHEDPSGMYADLKVGAAFRRFRVETKADQKALLQALRKQL